MGSIVHKALVRPRLLLVAEDSGDPRAASLARHLHDALSADDWPVQRSNGLTNSESPQQQLPRQSLLRRLLSKCCILRRQIERCDIVHIIVCQHARFWLFVIPVLVMARFFGKGVAITFAPDTLEDFLERWLWVARPFFRQADILIAPTVTVAAIYQRFGLTAEVPGLLFPTDTFSLREPGPLQPRLLSFQRLDKQGNALCLLKAFRFVKGKYPRAELTIVGSGPLRKALHAYIEHQKLLAVTIEPGVSLERALFWYQWADLLVNSSSLDHLPDTIQHAMAMGLPIVSTDAGSIPELVLHHVNGLLVAVNDHVRMAESIIAMIEHPDLVSRLTRHARADIERLAWSHVGSNWKRAYRRILPAGRAGLSTLAVPGLMPDE